MDPAQEAREAAARTGHLEARLTGAQALRYLGLSALFGLVAATCGLIFFNNGKRDLVLLLFVIVLAPISLLMVVSTLRQYFGRPTLVLDAGGLHHCLLGSIAWEKVVGMSVMMVKGRDEGIPFFALGLAPGARMQRRFPWRGSAGPGLRFPIVGMTQSPAQILAMAEVLRDRVLPPRLQNWRYGMSRETQAAFLRSQRLLADLARHAPTAPAADAELARLTQELEGNSAALRDASRAGLRKLRRRVWWVRALCGLALALAAWHLWTRLA